MTKKIIFWIDDSHVNFGIAKYFQEKNDYEIYAIFDVNHITKNFYKNQNIVKFKKVWFWREHISSKPHKPDKKYLQDFEKKYNLNFWKMAYSERKFFRFNQFHKFTLNEILSVTEDECKIFEKILNEVNPEFLTIGITDLHRNYLFTELCRAKGIKILMLWTTRFGDRFVISSDYDVIDDFDSSSIDWSNYKPSSIQNIEDYNSRKAVEKKFIIREERLGTKKIFERHLKFLIHICNSEYRKFYENWGKTKLRFLLSTEFTIPFLVKRSTRKRFLDKNSIKNPNLNESYIYYPLAHEPERTISLSAPFYTNQIEVISQIAKSIPINYQLFVKEHFGMRNETWRDPIFYKKILEFPNVKLIHPYADSKELIKNCDLVIAISGTTVLEAGFYQKPSIIFSDTSFNYLPFVTRVKSYEDLPNAIKNSLNKENNFVSAQHYLDIIKKYSFEVDPMKMLYDIITQLHDYNGLTREVDISETKMKNFLDNHSKEFEKLASEYKSRIDSG